MDSEQQAVVKTNDIKKPTIGDVVHIVAEKKSAASSMAAKFGQTPAKIAEPEQKVEEPVAVQPEVKPLTGVQLRLKLMKEEEERKKANLLIVHKPVFEPRRQSTRVNADFQANLAAKIAPAKVSKDDQFTTGSDSAQKSNFVQLKNSTTLEEQPIPYEEILLARPVHKTCHKKHIAGQIDAEFFLFENSPQIKQKTSLNNDNSIQKVQQSKTLDQDTLIKCNQNQTITEQEVKDSTNYLKLNSLPEQKQTQVTPEQKQLVQNSGGLIQENLLTQINKDQIKTEQQVQKQENSTQEQQRHSHEFEIIHQNDSDKKRE